MDGLRLYKRFETNFKGDNMYIYSYVSMYVYFKVITVEGYFEEIFLRIPYKCFV